MSVSQSCPMAENAFLKDISFESTGAPFIGKKIVDSSGSLSSLATQLPDESYVEEDIPCDWSDDTVESLVEITPKISPEDTLIFLDWDDTLFPTYELFVRRRMQEAGDHLSAALDAELAPWRDALHTFLLAACRVADHVVILTNASKHWVERSVCRFVPQIEPLLKSGRIKVVYSEEALRRQTYQSRSERMGSCIAGLSVLWASIYEWDEDEMDVVERETLRVRKKTAGMVLEGASYYHNRAWENVLSFGDAIYERDAVRSLASGIPGQCLPASRAKDITVPKAPSLHVMTRSLRMLSAKLSELVNFDGCLSIETAQTLASPFALTEEGFVHYVRDELPLVSLVA